MRAIQLCGDHLPDERRHLMKDCLSFVYQIVWISPTSTFRSLCDLFLSLFPDSHAHDVPPPSRPFTKPASPSVELGKQDFVPLRELLELPTRWPVATARDHEELGGASLLAPSVQEIIDFSFYPDMEFSWMFSPRIVIAAAILSLLW